MPHRAVIFAAAILSALLAVLPMASAQSGDAPMGAPRRWGAGMGVGPYGVVDLQTGRMLTTLPVVGWGGRGPAISFALYHNMTSPWSKPDGLLLAPKGDANADGLANAADIDPFVETLLDPEPDPTAAEACDMDSTAQLNEDDVTLFADRLQRESCEPYWTHSYSSYLIVLQYTQVPTVILVGDDGTRDVFTGNAQGGYTAPPGVFATLTADAPPAQGFTLTGKSQWTAYYEPDPLNSDNRRLAYIQDPSSNRLTCAYINAPNTPAHGKLDCVTDASDRVLDLTYNQEGRLCRVTDPIARDWHLLYEDPHHPGAPSEEGTGYFVALEDPMEYRITWEYTDCGGIANIADKNGSAADPRYYHAFHYSDGRLDGVIDPAPFTSQVQHFAYAMDESANQVTTYTDRRGEEWAYTFGETSGNLLETVDPLGHADSFAYQDQRPALAHEKTGYTNALGKTWTTEYDGRANVLTVADPMGHVATFEYDELNNLLTATPPADDQGNGNKAKRVEYIYHDGNHLTSVTSIHEPPAAENGPTPETQIVYWGPEDETPFGDGAWNGLVRSVTPPYDETLGNPVVTEYQYDQWGQLAHEREGPPSEERTTPEPVQTWIESNAAGQVTNSHNGAGCGDIVHDANGNITGITCCIMFAPPGGERSSWLPFDICPAPFEQTPSMSGEFSNAQYSPMGELRELVNTINAGRPGWNEQSVRQHTANYDELARMTSSATSTTEATWDVNPNVALNRAFTYSEDWTAGESSSDGPDGQTRYVATDTAGRVTSFTRGAITATVAYYEDDSVEYVTYGNGTRTRYTYDDAGRPVIIRHEMTGGVRIHELGYLWTPDGLVASIAEIDDANHLSTMTFTYDNRNRLTAEVRVGLHPYMLVYVYDLAGNRTAKSDYATGRVTNYTYDVSDPDQYGSQGNRLMHSVTYAPGGGVLEERWYAYDLIGNVELVIRKITGDVDENENQWYRGTQLYYTKDGHLWLSRALRWQYAAGGEGSGCENGPPPEGPPIGCEVANCEPYVAMEYRYQGGRGRYMVRPRDPETMQLYPYAANDGQWFDYDGQAIYGDYSVS